MLSPVILLLKHPKTNKKKTNDNKKLVQPLLSWSLQSDTGRKNTGISPVVNGVSQGSYIQQIVLLENQLCVVQTPTDCSIGGTIAGTQCLSCAALHTAVLFECHVLGGPEVLSFSAVCFDLFGWGTPVFLKLQCARPSPRDHVKMRIPQVLHFQHTPRNPDPASRWIPIIKSLETWRYERLPGP